MAHDTVSALPQKLADSGICIYWWASSFGIPAPRNDGNVSPGRPGNNITGAGGGGGVGVEGMEIDTVASCWANSEVRSAGRA